MARSRFYISACCLVFAVIGTIALAHRTERESKAGRRSDEMANVPFSFTPEFADHPNEIARVVHAAGDDATYTAMFPNEFVNVFTDVAHHTGVEARANTDVMDPAKKKKFNFTCPECELLVQVLEIVAKNASLLNFTHEALDVACALGFAGNESLKVLCHDLIGLIVKEFPKVVDAIEKERYSPEVVCAMIFHKCSLPCCDTETVPEQVHLSFAENDVFAQPTPKETTSMRVTWTTLSNVSDAVVSFRADNASSWTHSPAQTSTYTDFGWKGVMYTAVMFALQPDTVYHYQVGSASTNFSQTFRFRTLPLNVGTAARPLRAITIADMDYTDAANNTVAAIVDLVQRGDVDVVFHYGDISYADGDQPHWDDYFRKVEVFAAYVPYMTVPGNHEIPANFTSYKHRLHMPTPRFGAPQDAMFYDLNIGAVSVLMVNSESPDNVPEIGDAQTSWLKAALTENTNVHAARPWIFVFQHRPMYCTNHIKLQCDVFADLLRLGEESLFITNKVDLITAGHMHDYERTYPVAEGWPLSHSYANAPAPVYIVNGAAGNHEGLFHPEGKQSWSAFTARVFGFGRMDVVASAGNSTARVRFVDAATLNVVDDFTLSK